MTAPVRLLALGGGQVEPAGELLVFVEHAFTEGAAASAQAAAAAHHAGSPCRIVSVDSPEALAAWLSRLDLDVPSGSDPDGGAARAANLWDEAAFAAKPGWAQLGRDGGVMAAGAGDLPAAFLAFSRAAVGATPVRPPFARRTARWLGVAVVTAAGLFALNRLDERLQPLPAASEALGAAPGQEEDAGELPADVRGVPEPASSPGKPAPGLGGKAKGRVGGGWYAVPPSLAGTLVRWSSDTLEVEGADLPKPPMACTEAAPRLTAPLAIAGSWELDHVGTRDSKGARVAVRLLDDAGNLLPGGSIPGGVQITLASGRLVLPWSEFARTVEPTEGASRLRICVENHGGSGVVRVKGLTGLGPG